MTNMVEQTAAAPLRRLLHLCLGSAWDPQALDAARAVAAEAAPDWETFYRLANTERVTPLVYHHAQNQAVLPPPVEQRFLMAYYRNAQRHYQVAQAIDEAVACLDAAGIPVTLLKGAALIKTVYADPALRPMADFDLLVQTHEVGRAVDALAALGYDLLYPHPWLRDPALYTPYVNNIQLCKRGQGAPVLEVHWHVFWFPYQYVVPARWLWDTRRLIAPGFWGLGAEAQLLHLCGHPFLHHIVQHEPTLLWLYDVAMMITHDQAQIDWDAFLARVSRYAMTTLVQQMLGQVCALWNVPIPPAVLARAQAWRPTAHEHVTMAWIRQTQGQLPTRHTLGDVARIPGWGARLRFAGQELLPSPRYIRQRYGARSWVALPLYYVYRWVTGGMALLRRSRGGGG